MGVWEISTTFLLNKGGGGFVGLVGAREVETKALRVWRRRHVLQPRHSLFKKILRDRLGENTTLGTFPWEKQRGVEKDKESI